MKRTYLVRMAALLCAVFLTVSLAPSTSADEVSRYGYGQLKNDTQRYVYETVAAGIGACSDSISLSADKMVMAEDLSRALSMISRDYPEYFWFSGGYGYSYDGTYVLAVQPKYTLNGAEVSGQSAELSQARAAFDAAVNAAIGSIPASCDSVYEKALYLHDYVAGVVTYSSSGNDQTAYGALVDKACVCAGYTRAYQLLMNRVGIQCWYVTGQSYDPAGNLQAHAWNLVWLDGMCYYTDVTWDDQGEEVFHEYLNMSLEDISKTHFSDDPLPSPCGHDNYTFFRMNDGSGVCDIRDHKTAEEVADCFVLKSVDGDIAQYYCTIHYHGDDFSSWLSENIGTIAQTLGYTGGYGYQVIELGHEHHVTLSGRVSSIPEVSTPTEPETEPTQPSTQPSVPETEPSTQPTEPSVQPTEPVTQPTEPATQPTEPATQPTTGTEPENPVTQPTESTQEPSTTTKPSEATEPEETSGETVPSGSEQGTEPGQTEQITGTEESQGETIEPSQGQSGSDPSQPSGGNAASVTTPSATGAEDPDQPDDDRDGDMTGILIGAAVVVIAGGGTVAVLILRKKKVK